MFTVHATKKLLGRVRRPVMPPVVDPDTALGNWYANVLFWRPQVALLVNERTLFPVLTPLAPAATLLDRFPDALGAVLRARGVRTDFVAAEMAAMSGGRYAKTASRSVLGSMNEFAYLAGAYRDRRGAEDLVALSLWLADTPCGPLHGSHITPEAALDALVDEWAASRKGRSAT